MYDPDAVIQDSDIEMAELQQADADADAMHRRGFCDHQGGSGPLGDGSKRFVCYDCGKLYACWADRDNDAAQWERVSGIADRDPEIAAKFDRAKASA